MCWVFSMDFDKKIVPIRLNTSPVIAIQLPQYALEVKNVDN
jgi:hypothetical protein